MTYSHRSICAPRGSTLDISASYRSYDELYGSIVFTSWFRTERGLQGRRSSPDMRTLWSDGRVQIFSSPGGTSTLRIRNLTEGDSAEYQFKFWTYGLTWRSDLPGTGVTVTGTELQQQQLQTSAPSSAACLLTAASPWFGFQICRFS